ncbi:hypothetical protein CAEBREN_02168 [Caenorhabditis brenneri]|uniref:Sdz-33 F-box domain-containing protein n=1 Tax=Caenorhabditis brenneri TaxID=135651 RepID=G0N065_CAEBE|nr:hypothetical protein CAEBREN_02168 [Caenorhabditis brenneri]
MQCPEFYFWCRAEFSVEQFLKLNAQLMSFNSVSVTDSGINQFMKDWIHRKGVEGFMEALLWCRMDRDKDTLLEGLDAKEWDEEFEKNACGFVENFERCCGRVVDPFQSLTVSIHSDRITIYATEQRDEYDGKVSTSCWIPR